MGLCMPAALCARLTVQTYLYIPLNAFSTSLGVTSHPGSDISQTL